MALETTHVPIFVDSAGVVDGAEMTRLTYFYVRPDETQPASFLPGAEAFPLLLVDLEGVIVAGLGGHPFDSPAVIAALFDFIPANTPYVLTTSYFWLPQPLVRAAIGRRPARGDVLRLYAPLFLQACRAGPAAEPLTFAGVPPGVTPLVFSAAETRAFREWTGQTIERVRQRYYSRPELNLRSRHRERRR